MSEEKNTPETPSTEAKRAQAAADKAAEHKANFAASVGGGEPAPVETSAAEHTKPEHVPEKFWNKDTGEVNYEAWNKSHAELETHFHKAEKPKGDESEETPAGDKPETPEGEEEQNAVLETPAAQTAAENYEKNGKLEDSDYAALEAQGISREMTDMYIAGREAKANAVNEAAYAPTGGAENYAAMVEWASDNLTEGESKAFNAQMTTGDPDVIGAAVSQLYSRYSETANFEGDRVANGNVPTNDSSVFESRAEMTAAINLVENGRRKYDVDPAYRAQITKKIGATRKANNGTF